MLPVSHSSCCADSGSLSHPGRKGFWPGPGWRQWGQGISTPSCLDRETLHPFQRKEQCFPTGSSGGGVGKELNWGHREWDSLGFVPPSEPGLCSGQCPQRSSRCPPSPGPSAEGIRRSAPPPRHVPLSFCRPTCSPLPPAFPSSCSQGTRDRSSRSGF